MVRVKVCGLTRPVDAEISANAGADFLGFVLEPSSPRRFSGDISDFGAFQSTSPLVAVFGNEIITSVAGFDYVQSIGFDPLNKLPWFKTIPVQSGDTVQDLISKLHGANYYLLDRSSPAQGGTGQTIDWGLAAEVVSAAPSEKIFLAGGLSPANVADAVHKVRPYGVDASSKLECSPGIKDADLVRRFVAEAKGV